MTHLTAPGPLHGTIDAPPDKSISHRALILGGLAVGTTRIVHLLEGADVLATAQAVRALGAEVTRGADGAWSVQGLGTGGWMPPDDVLDLGNAGTGVRLLMGAVATTPITCIFTGDESLRARPMGRVLTPLERFGARADARTGPGESACLPVTLHGAADPIPISYTVPVPSAQVKSAILLAGLSAPGQTTVIERVSTRDHTERMLRRFGAEVVTEDTPEGRAIRITGQPELAPQEITVPGDPSSAAFAVVAGLIVPGSEVTLRGVMMNPLRAELFSVLAEMGADLKILNRREAAGEDIADLRVGASALKAIDLDPARVPSLVDEIPALAMACACAAGRSRLRGLAELRVKESDRLTTVAEGLAACGVPVTVAGDDLIIDGCGGPVPGGATVATRLDHRIAMSFLVLGLAAKAPIAVDDAAPIATSYPGFFGHMAALGALRG